MKAVVAPFNQEKAFSVITNLRMQLFGALAGGQEGHRHRGGEPLRGQDAQTGEDG